MILSFSLNEVKLSDNLWLLILRTVQLIKHGNTYTPLPPMGLSAPLWPWIIWNLWKSRNKLVFENKTYTAQEIVLKSITDAKEWSEAQASQKGTSQYTSTHTGSLPRSSYPPPANLTGMLVCNVDAAWNSVSGTCGIGGVFSGYNAPNLATVSEAHSHVLFSFNGGSLSYPSGGRPCGLFKRLIPGSSLRLSLSD